MTPTLFSNPDGPAVIVDPFSSGGLYAPAFKQAGVPVVAVLSRPKPPAVYLSSFHPEDFPEIITFTGDHEPVVRRLTQLALRCVLPGAESCREDVSHHIDTRRGTRARADI